VVQARAGEPALDAEVADARALPEPDAAYDGTLLLRPLYHLTEPADRLSALREAVRVIRPGGPVLDLARIYPTEPALVMSSAHLLAAGTVSRR
jgi:ubiquinone/menaquinone biosynthesis C-methylase UbiE